MDSPFVATCDVTVAAGCSLTIEAGAEARFDADTGLVVDGVLDVNGTSGAEVVFTSTSATPSHDDWRGLELVGTSTSNIEYAESRYGQDVIRGDLTQLQFDGGHVDLGGVACVRGGLDWDRVTDYLLNPIPRGATTSARFFLGKNSADPDYGVASRGEWRDVMDPDPACLP